jgi:dihydrofolate reductase
MRGLKRQPGPDLTILGSGSLIRQLAEAGLIDEFQLIITPGRHRRRPHLLEGIAKKIGLDLVSSRTFQERQGSARLQTPMFIRAQMS